MKKGKYWYKTIIDFCPVCGRESKCRERVLVKPEIPTVLNERYDWCDAL